MATTTAQLVLTSSDLLSDALSLSAVATLTNAGSDVGVTQTSGLSRKTTASEDQYTLYQGDYYTNDKAHKIYLKNLSTTAAEFFTVTIDDSPMGRIYAGDWAFIPWSAAGGVLAAFTVTFAATWATGDTFAFDGITTTLADTETTVALVDLIKNKKFPNWTVVETSASVVTFTSKNSNYLGLIEIGTSSDDAVSTTASNGTGTVARTVTAVASASDIKITPSVGTAMTLEHMLFHE